MSHALPELNTFPQGQWNGEGEEGGEGAVVLTIHLTVAQEIVAIGQTSFATASPTTF